MRRPDRYLWSLIPVVLLMIVIYNRSAIDIQIRNAYYVIATLWVGLGLSLALGSLGFIYWLCRKRRLVRWMTVFHLVATTAGVIAYFLFNQMTPDYPTDPARPFGTARDIAAILVGFSLFSQFVLIINVVAGMFRGKLQ